MAPICEGITILDFSQGMAGSLATMILADNGAEVIKVEPPSGDPYRFQSAWNMWNRGKKSVVLDLSTRRGLKLARDLSRQTDVLLESFRPESPEKLALCYDILAKANPSLVHCSITAMGPKGTHKFLAPYDGVVEAKIGGFLQVGPNPSEPAYRVRPNPSYATANQVVQGIVAGLRARDKTGRGQHLQTSLYQGFASYDSFSGLMAQMEMGIVDAQRVTGLLGMKHLPLVYMVCRCKDGQWLQMTCNTQQLFDSWMNAAGLTGLKEDPRFRNAPYGMETDQDVEDMRQLVLECMLQKTSDDWIQLFIKKNVAGDKFLTTQQFMDNPQTIENGGVIDIEDPNVGATKQIGPLIRFADTPSVIETPAPTLGQHQAELKTRANKLSTPSSTARPMKNKLKHPFDGLLVLDFATHLAAPFGASLIADLGARVIKIESLTGDEFRSRTQGRARTFQGKESLVLNLKTPEGQGIAHALIVKADGLLHNMRGDAPKRLGIDYATAKKLNPGLVYLYCGSYGSTGPGAGRGAFHPTAGALSGGALWQLGRGNEPPAADEPMNIAAIMRQGANMTRANEGSPDVSSALAVGTAMAMALYGRERTGQGQYLETTMLISNGYICSDDFIRYEGKPPRQEADPSLRGTSALQRLYKTAGGGWIFLCCAFDQEWKALCATIQREELLKDHRFINRNSRSIYDDQLVAVLAETFLGKTAIEWERLLVEQKVGCARADEHSFSQFFLTDPGVKENGFVVETNHPAMGRMMRPGPAVMFSDTPCKAEPAPPFGYESQKILLEIGMSESEIVSLRHRGIVAWEQS